MVRSAILVFLIFVVALVGTVTAQKTRSCCTNATVGMACTVAGDGSSGAIDGDGQLARFYDPVGVAIGSGGTILIGGNSDNRIRVILSNGTVRTLAGGGSCGDSHLSIDDTDPTVARFANPVGVAVDMSGNVLVCDVNSHRIRIVYRNGTVCTHAGNGGAGPDDGPDPLSASFYSPYGIVYDNAARMILIGGNYDQRIRVIYDNLTVSTLAGGGTSGLMTGSFRDSENPLDARFQHPTALALDARRNVIVADTYGNRVRIVWRDGSRQGVGTLAGMGPISQSVGTALDSDDPLAASFFTPNGIAVDREGNVLVSTYGENRIRIIYANKSVRTLAGFSTETVSIPNGGSFVDGFLRDSRFNYPAHMAVDENGDVVVADAHSQRIRMLCLSFSPGPNAFSTETNSITSNTATHTQFREQSSSRTVLSPFLTYTLSATKSTDSIDSKSTSNVSASTNLVRTHTVSRQPQVQPRPRAPGAVSTMKEVVGEDAAKAFVASGSLTGGIGSLLANPATASVAVRSGVIAAVVDCAFVDDSADPDLLQYPVTFDVDALFKGASNDPLGKHAGGVLCVACLVAVLQCLRFGSARWCSVPTRRFRAAELLCGVEAMVVQYYLPSVAYGATLLIRHSLSTLSISVSIVGAAGLCGVVLCRAHAVAFRVPREVVFSRAADPWSGTVKGVWSGALVTTDGAYFTASRDGYNAVVRLAYFVELLSSVVMGCAGGWRPLESEGSCIPVASIMLIITVVLLIFLLALHPYERRVDMALSVTFGVGLAGQAACALAVVASPTSRNAQLALSWLTVVLNWGLVAQLGIVGSWAMCLHSRHQHLRRQSSLPATASPSASIPMLSIPVQSSGERQNPLS